jgi:uncharacterized protein
MIGYADGAGAASGSAGGTPAGPANGAGALAGGPVFWRRLDVPGSESATLFSRGGDWLLTGTAAFEHEGEPCRLAYQVACDGAWRTRSAVVEGWLGEAPVNVRIDAEAGRWRLNGEVSPAVAGCIDVDLEFSPSTNLLPIRRLDLAVGARGEVRAAWLRFPAFTLEPLEQIYTRIASHRYRYESGDFRRELTVDDAGLVTDYPDLWTAARRP